MVSNISRREFLKLLGYGAVAVTLGPLAVNFNRFLKGTGGNGALDVSPLPAYAQTSGSWQLSQPTTSNAIHAALLPNGRILYVAGSGYHRDRPDGPFAATVLDVGTGSESNVGLNEDLFCCGLAGLANGNVLLAGGTLLYDKLPDNCNGEFHGLSSAYEFNYQTQTLVPVASMAAGRWYPTLVTLANGKVIAVNGLDQYGSFNRLTEVYDPNSQTWSKSFNPNSSVTYCVGNGYEAVCAGAGSPCFGSSRNGVSPNVGLFPRMHVMPSGLVISCGPQINVYSYDPATGIWKLLTVTSTYRHYGCSFLLPLHNTAGERGKILIVGGSPTTGDTDPATTTVEILDFDAGTSTNPVLRQGPSITYGRKELAPVILPNGKCVIFGGSAQGNTVPVYIPEMFDPVTETWQLLPAASVPRVYHQVSVLLQDGRVWTACGTQTTNVDEFRVEIFSPSYLFQGPRPQISGIPNVGNYGGSILIPTSDASNIESVSLVRLMSTTHHFEANQRFVWLQIINKTSNSVTVSAPVNANIAPPGYYMIHVLDTNGIPSVASIIAIPGSGTGGGDVTPPAQVSGLTVTTASDTQLNLMWNANTEPDLAHYNVYRGTAPAFPVVPGTTTPVGQPTSNSFSDTGLSPSTTYYYKVAAVDSTGNIGLLSAENSGTTSGTNPAFYDVPIPGNKAAALNAGGSVRFGEEAANASSILVGKALKSWKVRLRKASAPSGMVTAKIRRSSDDSVVASFNETIDSTTLGTAFAEYTFTLTNPYTINSGDRILIEYGGPAAVHVEIWNVDKIDGANTRRTRFDGTSYIGGSTEDVVGTMTS